MISILAYINNRSNNFLVKTFFRHCDKRMIQFLSEIVINLLEGVIPIEDKSPFRKYRSQLEKLYILGVQGGGSTKRKKKKMTAAKTVKLNLKRQRAVFCSPKGLKLVKVLFNIVQNRQFTR